MNQKMRNLLVWTVWIFGALFVWFLVDKVGKYRFEGFWLPILANVVLFLIVVPLVIVISMKIGSSILDKK